MLVCICSAGARAQVSVPGLAATPAGRQQFFETAPVFVDGSLVLRVAALASPPPGAMPIASRVFLIDGAIAQILAAEPSGEGTIYDPASFKVSVKQEGTEYALVATDKHHAVPFPILTVTAEDARHANLTSAELAQQWQVTLQSALVSALERRQPAEISRGAEFLVKAAIALILLTVAGVLLFRLLKNRLAAALVAGLVVIAWGAAITYGLLLFPATVKYGYAVIHAAGRVAIVWIAAIVLERLFALGIHHGARGWALLGAPAGHQARYLLRVPTISKALAGFSGFVVFFAAALATLSALSIPIASVITIGGIAALAIGFAAQSLVRDFLNGLLVLFEDQYVVGDYVMIGEYNGTVERLTLRIVQIRDSRGNLITIPHSSVSQVVNASRSWARVDYRIAVDANADLRRAIATLRATLEGMREDPAWHASIVEPIEWIGVEGMSLNGIVLRAVVRTEPLRQFDVRREINLRVFEAFGKASIRLGNDPSAPFVAPPQASPDPT